MHIHGLSLLAVGHMPHAQQLKNGAGAATTQPRAVS